MKRKTFNFLVATALVLLSGWITWRVTFYNVGTQIRKVFPGAVPYFDPVYSPDPTISATIRQFMPSYFGADESVGFSLTDSPEPLDLHQRFSRLSHVYFFSIHLTRCRITNLCEAGSRDFPGFILFDDCDFSELPADQRTLLRRYDPTNPTATKMFCIGGV